MNTRVAVAALALFATTPASFAASVGPSFYECFDAAQTTGIGQAFTGTCTAESPFAQTLRDGNFEYFEFEDWEAIALNQLIDPVPTNTTGVTITGTGTGVQNTGSADQDNGVIDNVGGTFGVFGNTIDIIFDAGALGRLPTHVGLLATGAGNFDTDIRVEIFGPGDALLGTIDNQICSVASCASVSEDDLFYGFVDPGGIVRIAVTDPTSATNIILFDHLQYGAAVPIPAAVWLFGSALGLLGWMRHHYPVSFKKRQHRHHYLWYGHWLGRMMQGVGK